MAFFFSEELFSSLLYDGLYQQILQISVKSMIQALKYIEN